MKTVIVSDTHANLDAWNALPADYDELWVLGGLISYGPQPVEVIAEVMENATLVVQGNHDYAIAHQYDAAWSPRYRAMAEATRKFTSAILPPEQTAYLRHLPQRLAAEQAGIKFLLTHATPSDALYGRCTPDSPDWVGEIERMSADVLPVGHSRDPLMLHQSEPSAESTRIQLLHTLQLGLNQLN